MPLARSLLVVVGLVLPVVAGCHLEPVERIPPPELGAPRVARPPAPVAGNGMPSVPLHGWQFIVIHHSDTARGSAASFDRHHREVNGWQSLGYHFVIGNGNGTGDGQIEAGPRWVQQQKGAHAGVDYYNRFGIGICLVGDFEHGRPTAAQMRSLAQLNSQLMRTFHIPPERIIGHSHAKPGRTLCPGRYFSIAAIRHMSAAYAGVPVGAPLASAELLRDSE